MSGSSVLAHPGETIWPGIGSVQGTGPSRDRGEPRAKYVPNIVCKRSRRTVFANTQSGGWKWPGAGICGVFGTMTV